MNLEFYLEKVNTAAVSYSIFSAKENGGRQFQKLVECLEQITQRTVGISATNRNLLWRSLFCFFMRPWRGMTSAAWCRTGGEYFCRSSNKAVAAKIFLWQVNFLNLRFSLAVFVGLTWLLFDERRVFIQVKNCGSCGIFGI